MQKKVLVVDSDYFFVEFFSELLTKRGYKVLKAYNGKEGIALLENNSVEILFADLVLPKVDGRQLFKFVRHKYNGCQFPIVALSGILETGRRDQTPIIWTRNRWFITATRDSLKHDFYHYFLDRLYEKKQRLSARERVIYEFIKQDD